MNDNIPKNKARKAKSHKDNQATPEMNMTSDELIENLRGKIQQVLVEKASNQNCSE